MKAAGATLKVLKPASSLLWLEQIQAYAKRSIVHEEEAALNFSKTIEVEGIMSTIYTHNYEYAGSKVGQAEYWKGRVFSSYVGSEAASNVIPTGFELRNTTTLAELDFDAFCLWIELWSTPCDLYDYQRLFNQIIDLSNSRRPFALHNLELTTAYNATGHWPATWRFISECADTQKRGIPNH